MNKLPTYINPSSELIECLDELYKSYMSCHPGARTTMVVYDTQWARDDGDPLYFDTEYDNLSDIFGEAHSYLVSNVCCEVHIGNSPIFLADDDDEYVYVDGVRLLGLPEDKYVLATEYSVTW